MEYIIYVYAHRPALNHFEAARHDPHNLGDKHLLTRERDLDFRLRLRADDRK